MFTCLHSHSPSCRLKVMGVNFSVRYLHTATSEALHQGESRWFLNKSGSIPIGTWYHGRTTTMIEFERPKLGTIHSMFIVRSKTKNIMKKYVQSLCNYHSLWSLSWAFCIFTLSTLSMTLQTPHVKSSVRFKTIGHKGVW